MTTRIGLVHALRASMAPVEVAFARAWPEAEVVNLYDHSLYADYQRWGQVTPEITRRVTALLNYSADSGADGILFTGSLFGESVIGARAAMDIPVLTAYEALIEAAFSEGRRLGLLATVPDTILMVERDAAKLAEERGLSYTLESRLVEGAMDALQGGDRERHDALLVRSAAELVDCQALMLGQHSMGPAVSLIENVPGRRILTSPETAVAKLKRLLASET